jgi:hypothetical protein
MAFISAPDLAAAGDSVTAGADDSIAAGAADPVVVAGFGDPGLDSWASATPVSKSAAVQIVMIGPCRCVFINVRSVFAAISKLVSSVVTVAHRIRAFAPTAGE